MKITALAVAFGLLAITAGAWERTLLDSSWLTEVQLSNLDNLGEDVGEVAKLYLYYFQELSPKEQRRISPEASKKCYSWLDEVATSEEQSKLHELHHKDHSECKKRVNLLVERLPTEKQESVRAFLDPCDTIWLAGQDHSSHQHHAHNHRRRRNHHEGHGHSLDDYLKTHLSWLTAEQAEALKAAKAAGKTVNELTADVIGYYNAATGETKAKATEILQNSCRGLITKVVGEEKTAELKSLKESGATHEQIATKIGALIEQVDNEHLKTLAQNYQPLCKTAFGVASRRRRHDGEVSFSDFVQNHLTWLNAEQKQSIVALKEANDREGAKAKVLEYYQAAEGETKKTAQQELQAACKELAVKAIGEEKTKEIKALKESGASDAEIEKKFDELVATATDEKLVGLLKAYKPVCKTVFNLQSRRRRDHHEGHGHSLDDYLKTHLSWLTAEQAEALKAAKAAGKTVNELTADVIGYYNAATGETKAKATEILQNSCRDLVKKVVGEEKSAELKSLKESGATNDEIATKIGALIEQVDNAHLKTLAQNYQPLCKTAFGVASRRRRHDGEVSFADLLKNHLTWLTDDQKKTLVALKEANDRPAAKAKILEFFNAAEGETKNVATEQVRGACKELGVKVLGADKVKELETLKHSGATLAEVTKQFDEAFQAAPESEFKTLAKDYKPVCDTAYGVPSRLRRHDGELTFENLLAHHLTWLTDDQKKSLVAIKETGDKTALSEKVLEYYNAATGDNKQTAAEQLQGACRELGIKVLGEEKYAELKQLKETGASKEAQSAKFVELLAGVTDPALKAITQASGPVCQTVFGLNSRRRRDHHEGHGHSLDDYLKTHLSWLAKATEILQNSCRGLIAKVVGEEKTTELKSLKESGATKEEIAAKIATLIDQVDNECFQIDQVLSDLKTLAQNYQPLCKTAFGVASRRRRDNVATTVDDLLKNRLGWLTTDQRKTIEFLIESNASEDARHNIVEYYGKTSGEARVAATTALQGFCRKIALDGLGQERFNKIKGLKEAGASKSEIEEKYDELVEEVTDVDAKKLLELYKPFCKGVYKTKPRRRRDHHHGHNHADEPTFDHFVKDHLSWLTDEQKSEVVALKADKAAAQAKIKAFYSSATGETKKKAVEDLRAACSHLFSHVLGPEKLAEVKALKEAGATFEDIGAKVDELLEGVTDAAKKAQALEHKEECRKLFTEPAPSRRRRTLPALPGSNRKNRKLSRNQALQAPCEGLLERNFGSEKAYQIKRLIEVRPSHKAIDRMVFEYLKTVTDPRALEEIQNNYGRCRETLFIPESEVAEATVLDYVKAVTGVSVFTVPHSDASLTDDISSIYEAADISESAHEFVNKCHGLFSRALEIDGGNMDNRSADRVIGLLRMLTPEGKRNVQAVVTLCKEPVKAFREDSEVTVIMEDELLNRAFALPSKFKDRIFRLWNTKCKNWVKEAITTEERSYIAMLYRTGEFKALNERVSEHMSRLDDDTRTQMGYMRSVCFRSLNESLTNEF